MLNYVNLFYDVKKPMLYCIYMCVFFSVYGAAMIEHCMQMAGLPENARLGKEFNIQQGIQYTSEMYLYNDNTTLFHCFLCHRTNYDYNCSEDYH